MDGGEPHSALLESIPFTIERLRKSFASGRTRPLQYRLKQLSALERMLKDCESEICQAVRMDLGRSELETRIIETSFIWREIAFAQKRLHRWARPERVRTPLLTQPSAASICREPFGVVLIIGPWNAPFQLVLAPLIGALAAGNCAVIKPSDLAPASSSLLAAELPRYLDLECIQVVEGGISESTALLAERFDYIFYTGNPRVGRIVLEAAAKHLTPVTLELGGKSPCIVDRSANLKASARRIVWGKLLNAGQVCVAPDYVLVDETVENALLMHMATAIKEFFGKNPRTSPHIARIVNQGHFRRLLRLIDGGGEIFVGGEASEDELYIAPTILTKTPPNAPIMQEEIFGPILPVLSVKSVEEAIAFINQKEKPLAIYVFAEDTSVRRQVINSTSSGAVTVNYPSLHVALSCLPFGGVGNSGMGAYHGRASFETFSHHKSVFWKASWPDLSFAYAPFSKLKERIVRMLM